MTTSTKKPRILYWDIETSFMLLAGFGLYDQNFSPDNVVQDWYIICASWMFEGDKKVSHVVGNGSDDSKVVTKLMEVISKADLLVHHNGDKFDLKKLRARAIYHKQDPLPGVPTVDTLKVSRRLFGFTSHRLGFVAQFLGLAAKGKPAEGAWLEILKGNKKALKDMVPYCDQDVRVLREVYLTLRPHMTNHPKLQALQEPLTKKQMSYEFSCDKCESHKFRKKGKVLRSKSAVGQMYQCLGCGGYKTV